jgi:hypothetical protein
VQADAPDLESQVAQALLQHRNAQGDIDWHSLPSTITSMFSLDDIKQYWYDTLRPRLHASSKQSSSVPSSVKIEAPGDVRLYGHSHQSVPAQVNKPWTTEEDRLLIQSVENEDNRTSKGKTSWQFASTLFPDRTLRSIQYRYQKLTSSQQSNQSAVAAAVQNHTQHQHQMFVQTSQPAFHPAMASHAGHMMQASPPSSTTPVMQPHLTLPGQPNQTITFYPLSYSGRNTPNSAVNWVPTNGMSVLTAPRRF